MIEHTLHDGRKVQIDPYAVMRDEYKQLIDPTSTAPDEPVISRATGIPEDELLNMPEKEWRNLIIAVVRAVINPDPL